ncbi:hypothetical protein D3C84_788660 [compost metagenome]
MPVAIPPAAITGTFTFSLINCNNTNEPVIEDSAEAKNEGLCPPASKPEAIIISTPEASKKIASSSVVAAPIVMIPRLRHSSNIVADGTPNIKLNTLGQMSSITST